MTLGRQGDADRGALAQPAFDKQLTAMQFDQAAGQRQTEAGAFMAARQRIGHLAERLLHAFDIFLRDADTGIGDGHFQPTIGQ
jgi:hypothetical protein